MISAVISNRELALSSDAIQRRIRRESELLHPSELRMMSETEAKRLTKLQLERLLRVFALIIGQPWFSTDSFLQLMVQKASMIMAGETHEPSDWDVEGFSIIGMAGHVPDLSSWKLLSDDDDVNLRMEFNAREAKLYEVFQGTTKLLVNFISVKSITFIFDDRAFEWARSINLMDMVKLAAYLNQPQIRQTLGDGQN